ncbi:hypothetical protein D3C87_1891710 [compost metagenome]
MWNVTFFDCIYHTTDAAGPLACFLGFSAAQIVKTDARMGIDHTEGLILAFEIFNNAGKDDVLDDISKVPGVIGVTVIHVRACFMPRRFRQYPCSVKCDIKLSSSALI